MEFNIIGSDTYANLGMSLCGEYPLLIEGFRPDYKGGLRHPSVANTQEGLIWFEDLYEINVDDKTVNNVLAEEVFALTKVPKKEVNLPAKTNIEDHHIISPQHFEKRKVGYSFSAYIDGKFKDAQYIEVPKLSPDEMNSLLVLQFFYEQLSEKERESSNPSIRIRITDFYEACGLKRTAKGYQTNARRTLIKSLNDLCERPVIIKFLAPDIDDHTDQINTIRFTIVSKLRLVEYQSEKAKFIKFIEVTLDSFIYDQMKENPYFVLTRLDYYSKINEVSNPKNINQLYTIAHWLRVTCGDIKLHKGAWTIKRDFDKLLSNLKMDSILNLFPAKRKQRFSRLLDKLKVSKHIRVYSFDIGKRGQVRILIMADPQYFK
jgi:hypothetical protein